MRLSVTLSPSPLTNSGTGKESIRVSNSNPVVEKMLKLTFYPEPGVRASNRIEIQMDHRTAYWVCEELYAKIDPRNTKEATR